MATVEGSPVASVVRGRIAMEVRDPSDLALFLITRPSGFKRRPLVITQADGTLVATVTWKYIWRPFTMTVTFADGLTWSAKGDLVECWFSAAGQPIAHVTQKLWRTRTAMTVDYRNGLDRGLLAATLWAITYIADG